jgi:hypothetical protein
MRVRLGPATLAACRTAVRNKRGRARRPQPLLAGHGPQHARTVSVTATKGSVVSAPFIFIATNKLSEGKLAAERDRATDLASSIEANEPQLLAFNEYVNEDGTEVGVYGEPSDAVLEMLRRQAGAGVPMTVKRQHLGGFTRVQRS